MNDFSDNKWTKELCVFAKLRETFKEVLKEKCSPQQLVNQNIGWQIGTNPEIVDAQMTVE